MSGIWASITAPQATIVSGLCTLAAALFGVLFGWWLFNGRVRDLKSAIEESDKVLVAHKSKVEEILGDVTTAVDGFKENFSAQLEALGQLRSSVSDIQDAAAPARDEGEKPSAREELQSHWYAIRDRLETVAADPSIDGRTRAAFARIDRRAYADLVAALAGKGLLGNDTAAYLEAVSIWSRYKNGRRQPTPAHLKILASFRKQIGLAE